MTRDEAARVLNLICKVHLVTPDAELLKVWYQSALEHCDYETGLAIARELAGSKDRMPKPLHFNELKAAKTRKPVAITGAGERWEKNAEEARKWFSQWKEQLR